MVFVTAQQSAEFLGRALPDSTVVHLPEATRTSWHVPQRLLSERTIGVLELGRRHNGWHEAVCGALERRSGHRHVYARWREELVFPSERALRDGFSDTVVSVCFPSSITHPLRSGRVETMTHRYLESMASGCLMVGHAPRELVDLMGFNPVVEVDWSAPVDQLLDILASPQRWQPHVDRVLRRVREVGDWRVRVRDIRVALEVADFNGAPTAGTTNRDRRRGAVKAV
ncbi:glycosyltransferase [Streptomyces sp. NBC_01537]|uniref:glycosyltransferase n=1 Tax=Streptomyces sp. NBC_01537 TaxID=2903896 RepID=UPI00386677BE